jgi:hypothetical protein
MSKQLLAKFYEDGDWNLVEEIILDGLKTVTYEVDSSVAPTDFKAQTLANKRIRQAMENFLAQAKVLKQQSPSGNEWA